MSNLRFLCEYVVRVPWTLVQITVTIITITEAWLASVEHQTVMINGVRTTGKQHLLLRPTASFDKGQMTGFRAGAHSVGLEVDVAKL
jgi:hypothetical protein